MAGLLSMNDGRLSICKLEWRAIEAAGSETAAVVSRGTWRVSSVTDVEIDRGIRSHLAGIQDHRSNWFGV
jgi:hypothetical protein